MVFYIFILDGTISNCGCLWRQYLDLLRLRSNMDRPNHTRNCELELYIIIIHRSIPNRRRIWRHHLHLHRLRCHLGSAFHRHQNQRIHPHQIVRIRPVSTRHFRSRRQHERTTLRLIRLRTDVDAETRTRVVVGRCGVGDGGGDDGDDAGTTYNIITKRILRENRWNELARLYSVTYRKYKHKCTGLGS